MKKLRKPATAPAKASFMSADDLPFMLSIKDVANALGFSVSKTYNLVHEPGFPRLNNVGRRVVVPRTKFLEWIEVNTN